MTSKKTQLKAWNKYFDGVKESLGKRQKGFERIFEYLISLDTTPIIVETGTYREENNYAGDGCSTLLFDSFVNCFSGYAYSIDIDPEACKLAQSSVKTRYGLTRTFILEGDSVERLSNLEGKCNLLYLDSYNITDWFNDWAPSAHHLKELFAAKNIIQEGTLIVVDDNILTPQGKRLGKGRLIYELMDALCIEPFFDDYQVAWIWQEP